MTVRDVLMKIAQAIAKHYAAVCIYDARSRGECLCTYCNKTDCKAHTIAKDLEVINENNSEN